MAVTCHGCVGRAKLTCDLWTGYYSVQTYPGRSIIMLCRKLMVLGAKLIYCVCLSTPHLLLRTEHGVQLEVSMLLGPVVSVPNARRASLCQASWGRHRPCANLLQHHTAGTLAAKPGAPGSAPANAARIIQVPCAWCCLSWYQLFVGGWTPPAHS